MEGRGLTPTPSFRVALIQRLDDVSGLKPFFEVHVVDVGHGPVPALKHWHRFD
jgi:hypothetical protein